MSKQGSIGERGEMSYSSSSCPVNTSRGGLDRITANYLGRLALWKIVNKVEGDTNWMSYGSPGLISCGGQIGKLMMNMMIGP